MKFQKGGCRCGKARYEIDLSNASTLSCHCTDCQKHLGAPFSVFIVVPTVQFRWIAKPIGIVSFGNKANRVFCEHCGTYLKWEGINSENEAEINAMTLDDTSAFRITEEIYTRSRVSWVKPIEGASQFEAGRK